MWTRRRQYQLWHPRAEWPEVQAAYPYGGRRRFSYPRGCLLAWSRPWREPRLPAIRAGESVSYGLSYTIT